MPQKTSSDRPIIDYNACLPDGYLPTAEQVLVTVNDTPLRVVRYSHCDVPFYLVHATLPEEGEHVVALSIKRHYTQLRVYPSRRQVLVQPQRGKQPAHFTITGNPYLVVECDGLGYLMLAFEPPRAEPEAQGSLQGVEAGIAPNAHGLQTEVIQSAIDRVSADPDLHSLVLPAGIYRVGDLYLRSHCRLHLAPGAVLKASDCAADIGDPSHGGWGPRRAALINAREADDIAITGHGHIDGNRPVLDMQRYYRDLICIKGCRAVRIEGPVFSSSCNWNTHLRGCEDVIIHRLKVLNNRPRIGFVNTDGVNPDCCRRVDISHCLMHTGDDAVAVKSCEEGDDLLGDVADITVSDLLAINNSATAKIGTETHATRMQRIRFTRIDAVHTARACVIDAFDVATISEVVFEDVQVNCLDDSRSGGAENGLLLNLHASAPTWRKIKGRSRIEGVVVRSFISDQPGRLLMLGLNEEFGIRNVRLENITIAGDPLDPANIEKNDSVLDMSISRNC